jgi:hypothetical protein
MFKKLIFLLVCSYFVREITAVSCTNDGNCGFGGSNCKCACCQIGLELQILGAQVSLCALLGGTVSCCDKSEFLGYRQKCGVHKWPRDLIPKTKK